MFLFFSSSSTKAETEVDGTLLDLVLLKDECNDKVKAQIDKVARTVRCLRDTTKRLRKERDEARQQMNSGQAQGAQQQQRMSTPTGPSNPFVRPPQPHRPCNAPATSPAPEPQGLQRNNSPASAMSPRTSLQPESGPCDVPGRPNEEPPAKRQKTNSHPKIFVPPPLRPQPAIATLDARQNSPAPPRRDPPRPPRPPRRYVACTMCWQAWLEGDQLSRHRCSIATLCEYCRSRGYKCKYHVCKNGERCHRPDCTRLHPNQWDRENDRRRRVILQ